MSCTNCGNSNGPLIIGGIAPLLASFNTPCSSTGCPSSVDAKCTFYSGAALACSTIAPGDSLEVALQKIDTQLCASAANYSTYNVYCLAPVTTQQSWVEKISQFVCNTQDQVTTFIGTTFPGYQAAVNTRFTAIEVPGTTSSCSSFLNIANTDTLQTVLQKLSNASCSLNTALDLSSVNWNRCFNVSSTPTTVAAGFNNVIQQICQLATQVGSPTLPTFNNVGTCLPAPLTANDTLVDTVNKIKTRLCQTPIFDINALTWNCVTKPSSTTTDLQNAFAAVLAKLDTLAQNLFTFSGDFAITATSPGNPCAGKTVSLSTTIADSKVAATATDGTPGTLQSKLASDANLAWDFSDPTKAKITLVSIPSSSDGKVKTDSGDPTADYLGTKVASGGATDGISVNPVTDTIAHQVKFPVSVDPGPLFTALLNWLINSGDSDLKTLFCQAVASCPSPCAAPTNISISFGGTTSTTTTTTAPTTSSSTTTTTTGATTTTTSSTSTSSSTTTTTTAATTTTTSSTTTTTTPSTTTTTSSSTTTTTTIALDDIYVGAQSSATPPNAAGILTGNHTLQNAAADVNADWTPFNATPQYCWVWIPNRGGTTVKTKWQDTVNTFNHGNIGGGSDLFGAPTSVTVSGVAGLLYFTAYQTQFANNIAMQA